MAKNKSSTVNLSHDNQKTTGMAIKWLQHVSVLNVEALLRKVKFSLVFAFKIQAVLLSK